MVRELIALDNQSKVWIYPADRVISYEELDEIRPKLFDFLEKWTSHNAHLYTYGNIFHQRFIGIFVDETHTGASGCSIDKSVHFMESLGAQFQIDFFDRLTFQYLKDEQVYDVKSSSLNQQVEDQTIDSNTLFFNNLVSTKELFLKEWLVPLKESWHRKFLR